ncbi:MAG: nucleotidyl transferase AbiEii/AbiGii toxin family protein [Actinomycetota bacterium]|nr:nucleotidyl transferase AbiEii/AbiGii toxin family protein [Actinomycetota bacterium]
MLFEPVFAALAARDVRYVVAGGVAVVLHGHPRLTADLDLVVDLAPDQARAAVEALTALGLRPRLPVDPFGFADPQTRKRWVRERQLVAFTLHDPDNPLLGVDLFADPPATFEDLWRRAVRMRIGDLDVPVVSLDDLVAMKRVSGRPKDLDDVDALQRIRDMTGHDDA